MSEKDIDVKVVQNIINSFFTIVGLEKLEDYFFIRGTRSADAKQVKNFYFDSKGKEIEDFKFATEEKDITKKLETKNIDLNNFHLYKSNITEQQTLVYGDTSNILITGVKDLKLVKEYDCAGKKLLQFKAKVLLNNKLPETEYMFLINKDGKRVFSSDNLVSDFQVYPDGIIIESIAKNRFFIYDYTDDKPISLFITEPGKFITNISYDAKTGMVNYSIENKQMPAVSITELRNYRIEKNKVAKLKSASFGVETKEKKPGTNFILVKEKFKE